MLQATLLIKQRGEKKKTWSSITQPFQQRSHNGIFSEDTNYLFNIMQPQKADMPQQDEEMQ